MKKQNENNVPVYSFLGYRLLEAKYNRRSDNELLEFGVKIIDASFEAKNLYVITVVFAMTFKDEEESEFIFNAGFEINEMNWFETLQEGQINSIFLASVFPYLRQKIHVLTDDYRGCVNIPIIDLRNVDLKSGITYSKDK